MSSSVSCPVCSRPVALQSINQHLDNDCKPSLSTDSDKTGPGAVAPIFRSSQTRSSQEKLTTPKQPRTQDSRTEEPPAKRQKVINTTRRLAPLAERLRPQSLDDFVGQEHVVGPHSLLAPSNVRQLTGSIIFWGPPGCGKTTLARLLAATSDAVFKELSATASGISDVRSAVDEAKNVQALTGRRTILFLDEIHRFNKSQQDVFLPFLEQGAIQLVGATTENPSFRLTSALLSRCRVLTLEPLTNENIRTIILRAVKRVDREISADFSTDSLSTSSLAGSLTQRMVDSMVNFANGDARVALSLLDLSLSTSASSEDALIELLRQSVITPYDRQGEAHYDMISALHKSIRGGSADGALYWMARMLNGGEDPLFIARRLVICASEDIGLADPHALPLAMAALQACQLIGMPECRINLAHTVVYLAEAPKSTRAYEAYNRAEEKARSTASLPVPMQVRNAPTKLMSELGYSEGYRYNPDYMHPVHNNYLPVSLSETVFLRKAGDNSGKLWDEDALKQWEMACNKGKEWEGRTQEPM